MMWSIGWGYVVMAIGMLLFWGLVIAGVVVLVRTVGSRSRSTGARETAGPERMLAERFARGQMSEDEYRTSLDTIRRS